MLQKVQILSNIPHSDFSLLVYYIITIQLSKELNIDAVSITNLI